MQFNLPPALYSLLTSRPYIGEHCRLDLPMRRLAIVIDPLKKEIPMIRFYIILVPGNGCGVSHMKKKYYLQQIEAIYLVKIGSLVGPVMGYRVIQKPLLMLRFRQK